MGSASSASKGGSSHKLYRTWEWELKSGYGVRSSQLSLDSREVLFGCKDGTIIRAVFDQDAIEGRKTRSYQRIDTGTHAAIRYLCDLGGQVLVAALDDGNLWAGKLPPLGSSGTSRDQTGSAAGSADSDGAVARSAGPDAGGFSRVITERVFAPAELNGGATFLDWLDNNFLLLSFKYGGSFLLDRTDLEKIRAELRDPSGPRPASSSRILEPEENKALPGIHSLICAVPVGSTGAASSSPGSDKGESASDQKMAPAGITSLPEPDSWLLIASTGRVWWLTRGHVTRLSNKTPLEDVSSLEITRMLWKEPEARPGIIMDFTALRTKVEPAKDFTYAGQLSQGVLIATDTGVWRIELGKDGPQAVPMSLPHVDHTCVALTWIVEENKRGHLWVADHLDNAQLLWTKDYAGEWQRSGIVQEEIRIQRAITSWRQSNTGILMALGCSGDRILLRHLEVMEQEGQTIGEGAEKSREEMRELFARGDVERLKLWMERDLLRRLPTTGQGDDDLSQARNRARTWHSEAMLSHLIERAAEDRDILLEALRVPRPALPVAVLSGMSKGGMCEGEDRAEKSLLLWTHTFLGAIRRGLSPRHHEEAYRGLIRWLVLIHDFASREVDGDQTTATHPAFWKRVERACEDAIVVVRKWGLGLNTYLRKGFPLKPLVEGNRRAADKSAEQASKEGRGAPSAVARQAGRSFDALIYDTMLFRRRHEELARWPMPPRSRKLVNVAEGLAVLQVPPPTEPSSSGGEANGRADGRTDPWKVVAAWSDSREPSQTYDLEELPEDRWRFGEPAGRGGEAEGTGRVSAIHLIYRKERTYVLEATHSREHREGGSIRLGRLDGDGWKTLEPVSLPPEYQWERIRCFLELEDGRIVCGLGRRRGPPGVAILQLETAGPGQVRLRMRVHAIRLLEGAGDLESPDTGSRPQKASSAPDARMGNDYATSGQSEPSQSAVTDTAPDNSVRALACFGKEKLLLGMDDGWIWVAQLPTESGGSHGLEGHRLDRLTAPVKALEVQQKGERQRVYVGAQDGSIFCYELMEPLDSGQQSASSDRQTGGLGPKRRAILWVAREESPVVSLHLIESVHDGQASQVILAVLESGRIVPFDARWEVEAPESRDGLERQNRSHQRLRVPGLTFPPLDVGVSVIASRVLPSGPRAFATPASGQMVDPVSHAGFTEPAAGSRPEIASPATDPRTPVARLVLASAHGELLLIGLLPTDRDLRRKHYEEIKQLLVALCFSDLPGSSKDAASRCDGENPSWRHRGRVTEVAYGVVPAMTAGLVRHLLNPERPHVSTGSSGAASGEGESTGQRTDFYGEIDVQWVPRHIRRILKLRREYLEKKPGSEYTRRDREQARYQLRSALMEIRALDDRELFVEVLQQVWRWTNRSILPAASGDPSLPLHIEYMHETLYSVLREAPRFWSTAEEAEDLRLHGLQMRRQRCGDKLLELACNDPDGPRFRHMLEKRFDYIQWCLTSGDSVLTLDTLRGVNVLFLRTFKRLTIAAPIAGGDGGGARPKSLPLWLVDRYFGDLCELSATLLHGGRGLDKLVGVELTRSFALGMAMCPERTLRITFQMLEAGVPREVWNAIDNQFKILEKLVAPVDDRVRVLFELDARREKFSERPLFPGSILKDIGYTVKSPDSADALSSPDDNQKIIWDWSIYQKILNWIERIRAQLESNATRVPLEELETILDQLIRESKWSGEQGSQEQELDGSVSSRAWRTSEGLLYAFRHSFRFWKEGLLELKGILNKSGVDRAQISKADNVRPELVLLAPRLAQWCGSLCRKLEEAERDFLIFEPQKSIYYQHLERLRRVCDSFDRSASVQKNLVRGVLGHNLLELLDEHVLELWEIAQAIDPPLVWGLEERQGSTQEMGDWHQRGEAGASEHFASYVVQRARRAESIPKNLRALRAMLESPDDTRRASAAGDDENTEQTTGGVSRSEPNKSMKELIRVEWAWERDKTREGTSDGQTGETSKTTPGAGSVTELGEPWLEESRARMLRLTFDELNSNHVVHGKRDGKPKWWLEVDPTPYGVKHESTHTGVNLGGGVRKVVMHLTFPIGGSETNKKRLDTLKTLGLQGLMEARSDSTNPSNGSGLYLASLAAAIAGFKLRIDGVYDDHFVMVLEGLANSGERSPAAEVPDSPAGGRQ